MSIAMNEAKKSEKVVTPSMPTQSPLHSVSVSRESTIAGAERSCTGRRFGARPACTHFARNGGVKAIVFFVFIVFGECGGGHGGRSILIDGFFVDSKHLGAGVAIFQVEIAGSFELDSLIVGRI